MRRPRAGGPFVTPIEASGTTAPAPASGRGKFTLAAGTYFFPLGGIDAPLYSVHLEWDASAAVTSATIEDSDLPETEASYISTTAGEWIDEDPTTAFVGVVSAGTTVTNGVVAHTAGAAGGAMFHVADTAAARSRLKVVVATGGVFRCTNHGKE